MDLLGFYLLIKEQGAKFQRRGNLLLTLAIARRDPTIRGFIAYWLECQGTFFKEDIDVLTIKPIREEFPLGNIYSALHIFSTLKWQSLLKCFNIRVNKETITFINNSVAAADLTTQVVRV